MIVEHRKHRSGGTDVIHRIDTAENFGEIIVIVDGAEYRISEDDFYSGFFQVMKVSPDSQMIVVPQSGNVVLVGHLGGTE